MTTESDSGFHARARYEAARYGADAWVWVRELVQNARDAGAGQMWFEVSSSQGLDRIACRDNGCGMTFAHARRYLFTLYASSKRGGARNAGRFGIGFWSILRFAPTSVTIRSRSRGRDGWQVRLDGDLNVVEREPARMDPGTEIVLERSAGGEDLVALLRAAVLRDAPFVTRRGHGDRPVDVRINGDRAGAKFDLPPPSLRFRSRGLRGVVGLAPEPGVEVFVHGLRVRDAASFDDLLLTGRRGRQIHSVAVGGLAPRALMDSSRLTVLLARGDAREDRALRRLVAVGHREIRRLVRAELDRHVRPSWPALWLETARGLLSRSRLSLATCAAVLVVLGAVAGWRAAVRTGGVPTGPGSVMPAEPAQSPRIEGPRPYIDLGGRYRGPAADFLESSQVAVDIEYRPESESPYLAALLMTGIDAVGAPLYPSSFPSVTGDGVPCIEGCLEVAMTVADDGGVLRLPVATGHAVDGSSIRLNGEPLALTGAVGGLPAVDLSGTRGGRLIYRSREAPGSPAGGGGGWPPLPPEVLEACGDIRNLASDARPDAVVDWVGRRVVYDTSPATARRHLSEQRLGRGLFKRSLTVGAGDCDVQNALAAAMLREIGFESRLAVGWVGAAGRARPGLHAWVEYLAPGGRWQIADASAVRGSASSEAARRAASAVKPVERETRGIQRALAVGLAVLLLLAVVLVIRRDSPQRTFSPGHRDGVADLVRAAAVHPESFGGVSALYHRKLVPVIGGRPISVARALAVAARGRLAVAAHAGALVLRAALRGTVIDGDATVGAAAAEALGAVDLDEWDRLLSRSRSNPVASRVEDVLTAAGEPFRLRIAEDVGEDVAVLDGSRLGLSAGQRWMVFDATGALWCGTSEIAHHSPAAAALFLAVSVIERLGLPRAVRGPCLAELARAALDECDGGRS